MVETYILCILPEEWLTYSYDQLEAILYNSICASWNSYETLSGVIFTLRGIRTMIVDYNDQLWFRRINDTQNEPNRDYFMLYLYSCLL